MARTRIKVRIRFRDRVMVRVRAVAMPRATTKLVELMEFQLRYFKSQRMML